MWPSGSRLDGRALCRCQAVQADTPVIRKLKTFLGRVYRDICRKVASNADVEARFARLLGLVKRLLTQQLKNKKRMATLPTFLPHCHEPMGSV